MLDNWEGNEQLRVQIASSIEYYGNDNDQADQFAKQVFDAYVQIYRSKPRRPLESYPRRHLDLRARTRLRQNAWQPPSVPHEILLAPNLSPTPEPKARATAVINSFCKRLHQAQQRNPADASSTHPQSKEKRGWTPSSHS